MTSQPQTAQWQIKAHYPDGVVTRLGGPYKNKAEAQNDASELQSNCEQTKYEVVPYLRAAV